MSRHPAPARTRTDEAVRLIMLLNGATALRVKAMIAGHTAETFAKAHRVPVAKVRETFEQAVARHG